jgi:hypothetical protein
MRIGAMAEDARPSFLIGLLARRVIETLRVNRLELAKRAIVPVSAYVVLLRLGFSGLVPFRHQTAIEITVVVAWFLVLLHFVLCWTRLLQAGPGAAGHPFGFWMSPQEWRLTGHGIMFTVFWFVIDFAVHLAHGWMGAVVGWAAWGAGTLLFYGFLSRHLLMFPMTAVDEEAKFGGSWDLTRPVWGPYVALIALFVVPMGALTWVAAPFLGPHAVGVEVSLAVQGLAAYGAAAVMATVLTVVYGELRPETPAR